MPPICKLHKEVVWECVICREAWYGIDEMTDQCRLREGYAKRFMEYMKEREEYNDDSVDAE